MKKVVIGLCACIFGLSTFGAQSTIKAEEEYVVRTMFDFDENGRVDMLDLFEMNRLINSETEWTLEQLYLADANKDGKIDASDREVILFYTTNPTVPRPTVKIPVADLGDCVMRMYFDFDNNKRIDLMDFGKMRSFMSNPAIMSKGEFILADYNGNGVIDEADFNSIQHYLSGTSNPEKVKVHLTDFIK